MFKKYTNILQNGKDKKKLISNFDFYFYANKDLPILTDSEIINYKLDNLLNNKFKSVVILIENEYSNHWVCVNKVKSKIEYFDSYGVAPPQSIKSYLDKQDIKYIFNKTKYQELSPDINTCGPHVLFRIMCVFELDMNLNNYKKFMLELCKKHDESPDDIVSIFVKID